MGAKGDSSEFEDAMADARRIEDRDAVRPAPGSAPKTAPSPAPSPAPKTLRRRRRVTEGGPQRFEIERIGERIEGKAAGIDTAVLRKLRNGIIPRDARVDLHGFTVSQARQQVSAAVEKLREGEGRRLLVIHGRGRHSDGEPVLKEALLEWLAEPPLAEQVMAFASATGGDGGVGATYVLLRRDR